jgi:hypothetical protein
LMRSDAVQAAGQCIRGGKFRGINGPVAAKWLPAWGWAASAGTVSIKYQTADKC